MPAIIKLMINFKLLLFPNLRRFLLQQHRSVHVKAFLLIHEKLVWPAAHPATPTAQRAGWEPPTRGRRGLLLPKASSWPAWLAVVVVCVVLNRYIKTRRGREHSAPFVSDSFRGF